MSKGTLSDKLRTHLRFHATTAVVALLGALPAAAIVYVMPTDESMVDRSPIIVFGEVLSVQPGSDGRLPTTDYLFAVEEVLKGFVAGSGIMVRQPGGLTDDGRHMWIMGLPMLAEGDRVLLFLRPEEQGAHTIVEYALGMFWEVEVGGRSFLLREPSLRAGELPPPGDPSAHERDRYRLPRKAALFRRWIQDRAAGVEGSADYFETEDLPKGVVAVGSPYRLFDEECGVPARLPAFDRGESLDYVVYAGGQPGVPGGGLQQVRAGMSLWNRDAQSRANLGFLRTTSERLPTRVLDNTVRRIMYEDPYDEIEGSLDPQEGGTLAVNWRGWYESCQPRHRIPGRGTEAIELFGSNIVTQDGLGDWLQSGRVANPANYFERVIAHELGHAIGIDHPCEPEEAGCNDSHEHWGALMWPTANSSDTSRARLHDDDRDAVRHLYPAETDSRPDLVVESPRSTATSVAPRGAFRFAATVRNSGDSQSDATTLRYYRSSDSRITTSDTPIGTDPVTALSASGTDRQNIGQRAPSTPGTYYYGACVDAVADESDTTNNCSSGVGVTVIGPSAPDLVVESPRSTESSVAPRGAFRFAATVRNSGDRPSVATTLRYYRSSDSRITTSDTPIGTDPVSALSASGTDRQNIGQRAPSTPGTYYYGACVDSVAGESDTTNNCSSGVPISVVGETASCSGDTCLLQGQRFRVKARYSKAGAPSQSAGAVEAALAGSAGLFDGESGSPELLVRIVNQCRTTGYWAMYAGVASDADFSVAVRHVETNELKWFRTRDRQSIVDTGAFPCTTSDDRAAPADPGDTASGVACSGDTCLLQEDRFRTKSWYAFDGGSSQAADAVSVDLGESAGLFAFDSGNPELLLRIADTCDTSGYWTVYAGTAADADFRVAVRDTETNQLKWFRSQGGESVADAGAFPCGVAGNSGFDLAPANRRPEEIAYGQGRFYVADGLNDKVYAYRGSDGRHDAAADFDLTPDNSWPEGIAYAEDRLYVVDYLDDKVYAYRGSDGRYDSLVDFDLAPDNSSPRGITYAENLLYVVDYSDGKVYAYRVSDGSHEPAADFDLAPDNSWPEGITYAEDRLYVVDYLDDKVYAYRVSDGSHEPTADFDLALNNSSPEGITHAGGKLFVLDNSDDRVYAYSLDGSPSGGTDDHGDSFASATSVTVPSTTPGDLEEAGDNDYFRLVLNQAATLTVETTGSTDTYGTLFDGNGASLESNDDGGAGTNFEIERAVAAGTYYVRVRGFSSTTTGAYALQVSTSGSGSSAPDLVVQSPSVSDTSLTAGQSFTFRATVYNRGDGRSASTTLRYYRSSNSTISTSDTQVGTDAVSGLAASGSSAESIILTAPSTAGTYYYGACVDSVSDESNTNNNCSGGTRVTVSSGGVTEYRYDDGDTSSFSSLRTNAGDVHEQEFAQRFRLSQSGTVDHVTVCVARRENVGNSSRLPFKLTFYADSGGRPGSTLGEFTGSLQSPPAGGGQCYRLGGSITAQRLSGGDTWLGLSWLSSTGMAMMVDDRATGSTRLSVRARLTSNSSWIAWQDHPTSSVRVFLIRLGVNHGGSTAVAPSSTEASGTLETDP